MEYVGLKKSQQISGEKQCLECEVSLLETIDKYRKYKKLRKQELALKRLLKRAMSDLQQEVKDFNSLMPKLKEQRFAPAKLSTSDRKRSELQDEIDEIKRKIAELSG